MSVFWVDEGMMLPMDVNLSTKSVESLKKKIASQMLIPVENQVLLVNSGESLDSDKSVCSYSDGSDDSPIYLYSNNLLEEDERPPITASALGTIKLIDKKTQQVLDQTYSTFREFTSDCLPESYWASFRSFQKYLEVIKQGQYPSNKTLLSKIEDSLCLHSTYDTVIERVSLSQQLYDHDNSMYKCSKNVLNELHLQQRGWLAAVSNLNATIEFFTLSVKKFKEHYSTYLASRKTYIESLTRFNQDIKAIDRIPVLPGLVPESFPSDISSPVGNQSLYQWLSSQEKHTSIEEIAKLCTKGLEHYNVKFFEAIQSETCKILTDTNNEKMIKIQELTAELSCLNQLLQKSQDKVQDQKNHAIMFKRNAQSANGKENTSILADLCILHEEHLLKMKNIHQFIHKNMNKCIACKKKLSQTLHIRFAWITLVQKSMSTMNSKLVLHCNNLKRLQCHLEILQQIHTAPELYVATANEVLRRKEFSKAYLQWSTTLFQQASDLYKKEAAYRKAFGSKIKKHFVCKLFPGLDDSLPPFTIKSPKPFDVNLPPINPEDMESLKQHFPYNETVLQTDTLDLHFERPPATRQYTDDSGGISKWVEPKCAMLFSLQNLEECIPKCENDFEILPSTHTHQDSDTSGGSFTERKIDFEKIDAQFAQLFGFKCDPLDPQTNGLAVPVETQPSTNTNVSQTSDTSQMQNTGGASARSGSLAQVSCSRSQSGNRSSSQSRKANITEAQQ